MKPKKIFIWEKESIIALDLRTILSKAADFTARIIKPSEDIFYLISNEKPELFILSTDVYFKISEKVISIIKNFNIPVIVMSAGNYENLQDTQLNKAMIYKVIKKPFDENELFDCVQECLDQKADFNAVTNRAS